MSELERFGLDTQISTYALRLRARLKLQHEKGFGVPKFREPPEEYVEAKYQEQLMAGFQLYQGKGVQRKKVMCKVCFQAYTSNGTCNCE